MKSCAEPGIKEPDNFDSFVKYRKGAIRKGLISLQSKIPYFYHRYRVIGAELHKIKNFGVSQAEKDAAIYVYEDYKSNAISDYRKKLFGLLSCCPYCGMSETAHLDHYLPKSEFSEYALFTLNLIPCCYNCNSKYKKVGYESGGRRAYFHPYTDDINSYEFLVASVLWCGESFGIDFSISGRSGADPELYFVVKNHFSNLELRSRYIKEATGYLDDMRQRFLEDKACGNFCAAIVSRYKDAVALYGNNYWMTALLKALTGDEKFMSGDFVI